MRLRIITFTGSLAWTDCAFCQNDKVVGQYTILHKKQKLIRKLCAACARHLSEFGDDNDFEILRRQR